MHYLPFWLESESGRRDSKPICSGIPKGKETTQKRRHPSRPFRTSIWACRFRCFLAHRFPTMQNSRALDSSMAVGKRIWEHQLSIGIWAWISGPYLIPQSIILHLHVLDQSQTVKTSKSCNVDWLIDIQLRKNRNAHAMESIEIILIRNEANIDIKKTCGA